MGISTSNIRTTPPSSLAIMDEASDSKVAASKKSPSTEAPNLDAIPKGAPGENDGDKLLPAPKPSNREDLQSARLAVKSSRGDAGADIFAVLALFQRLFQEARVNARDQRNIASQSRQKSLLNAAEEEKKGIPLRMWGGVVQGILQAGGGAVSLGGAVLSGVGSAKAKLASPAPTKPSDAAKATNALASKQPVIGATGSVATPKANLAGAPAPKQPAAPELGSSPTVSAKANEKALAAAKNKSEQEPQATQEQVSRSRPSNQKRQHEKEIELTPMKNQGSAGASESKKPAEISKPDSNPASEANESNSQPVTTKEKSLRERAIEANEKQNQLKEQELSNREADEFNRSVDQWEKNLSRKMDSYRTISAGSEATNQLASGIGASARAWNENRAAEHDAEKSFQNAAAQKHEMDYQQQNEIFNQSIENSRYVLDKLDASLRSELEAKKSIARNMA